MFVIAASEIVRIGLESLIAGDARFVVAGSGAELSRLTASEDSEGAADVVLLDLESYGEETYAALRAFADDAGESNHASVVLIGAEASNALTEALRVGTVRAALERTASGGEILTAIEAASAGLVALGAETLAALLPPRSSSASDELSERIAPFNEDAMAEEATPVESLTAREREVLDMLAEGLSNKEIAQRMKISEHTVKFHVAQIFAKFGVSTRTEAVMRGIRRGLVMM